jgi:predicted phage terminase large subunit-like protein
MYLLDVYRRKLDFPALKQAVIEQARLYRAEVVLIEDKASGTSLIQELHVDNFSIAQAAPERQGDKVMRLHAQTAKIKGGFAKFPKSADWLEVYLRELLAFPNAKNDDQVDSTVFALAWTTEHGAVPSLIRYYKGLVEQQQRGSPPPGATRLQPPKPISVFEAYDPETGSLQKVFPERDGTFLVPNLYAKYCRMSGWTDV